MVHKIAISLSLFCFFLSFSFFFFCLFFLYSSPMVFVGADSYLTNLFVCTSIFHLFWKFLRHWLPLPSFLCFTSFFIFYLRDIQFSCSVMSDFLWPHESHHTRPPCPSPNPGVYPNSCPLNWWCHPTISSSIIPFSSCPQSFPASGSFPMSQLFASGGQRIGVSTSTSVLPMNTQDWHLGWTGWISLQSKGLSRVFSNTTVQKHQFFSAQLSSQFWVFTDIWRHADFPSYVDYFF